MSKKKISELARKVEGLVGFGAVQKYGYKLNENEIKAIADYSEARGGNRKRIESVLRNAGRPFDISDPRFESRCLLCKSLNNYCCC